MTTKEHRYILTTSRFIYARNDNEAKLKAAKFAKETDSSVEKLEEFPFASLTTRLVTDKDLSILENKIIEI